jgi:ComF family protein
MHWETFAELWWPPRCPACAGLVPIGSVFCRPCQVSLLPLEDDPRGQTWPREAIPVPEGSPLHGKLGAVSLFAYGGSIKDALLRLKHGPHLWVARPLGRLLGWALRDLAREVPGALWLAPVPLHRQRLRDRGFNQSLELLRHARASLPRKRRPPMDRTLLVRVRPTPSLGHESRTARLRLVRGAFAMGRPGRCRGRHVVLLDDVLTTGATALECAKVLVADGASGVTLLTLARSFSAFIP